MMPDSTHVDEKENAARNIVVEPGANCVKIDEQDLVNKKNIELNTDEDPSSEALLSDEGPGDEDIDLSNTNEFEVVIDESDAQDKHDVQRQEAKKRMLSFEIARQKGVEIHGNRISVPGRVSLTPITLLAVLLSVIGFAGSFIHFSVLSPNYLIAVFIIEFIIFAQIVIYHSSYRARRTSMGVIHILGCIVTMALVDWAFLDIIFHPKKPDDPHAILGIATIAYSCVPLLLISHLVYFGRGKREILIRRKKTQADKPTKIIKTQADKQADKPAQIIKTQADKPAQSIETPADKPAQTLKQVS